MKKPELSLKKLEPVFEKISKLTRVQRLLICIGTFVLLLAPTIYFSFLPKIQQIDELKTENEKLEKQLAEARKKSAQLAMYRQMAKEAEADFAKATQKLPQAKEIPNLLASISGSGQDAGLEFLLFQPEAEVAKDFYAEIPVSIAVSGNYYNVSLFFDKVAALSRIVNIRNIVMTPEKTGEKVNTTCTAVTYMFIEAGQQAKKST